MLDDLGLLPALLWHFERYTAQTGVRVNLEHAGVEQRFGPDVETAAYRIVQEALTNVARHAAVGEVTVRLWAHPERLNLQIEDQGAGFDPRAALAASASSGLVGMRERATLAGGWLVIEAAPGSGARLLAEFPLGDPGARKSE
jgi:signal transduction histidine kinase